MEAAVKSNTTKKSVKEWLIQLTREPLPILPHTGATLLKRLQDPNIALNQVSGVVMQDPVLTLHLLRQANKLNRNEFTDITNISHTVTLLGLGNVQKLSRNIPILKKDLHDNSYLNYLTAVMRSIHAAEQARSWAIKRSYHAPDEIYLATLMYAVPMWCLWRFANHEMNLINHLMLKERIPKNEAELVVLGCSTDKICQALAKLWNFPEVVRLALDKNNQPSQRFVIAMARAAANNPFPELPAYDPNGISLTTPTVQVLLANWLAAETDIDWYSRQTTRSLRVLSAFLKVPENDAYEHTQQIALEVSRRFPIPGIVKPAAHMLFLKSEAIRRTVKLSQLESVTQKLAENWAQVESGAVKNIADIEAAELQHNSSVVRSVDVESDAKAQPCSREIESESVAKPSSGDGIIIEGKKERPPATTLSMGSLRIDEIKAFVQQLKSRPEDYHDIGKLLGDTCETINTAIGMERVVAGLLNKRGTKLRGFCGSGTVGYPKFRNFESDLEGNNLFSRLIVKPAAIWIDPIDNAKALNLVPASFCDICETDKFLLHSIFSEDSAIAVIYADQGPGNSASKLKPEHYKSFKLVCAAVNQCLSKNVLSTG